MQSFHPIAQSSSQQAVFQPLPPELQALVNEVSKRPLPEQVSLLQNLKRQHPELKLPFLPLLEQFVAPKNVVASRLPFVSVILPTALQSSIPAPEFIAPEPRPSKIKIDVPPPPRKEAPKKRKELASEVPEGKAAAKQYKKLFPNRGKSERTPLSFEQLNQLIETSKDKDLYIRLRDVILDHATQKETKDKISSKPFIYQYKGEAGRTIEYPGAELKAGQIKKYDGREFKVSLTYPTTTHIQFIQFPDGGMVKIKFTPRSLWHTQAIPGDPECSSYLDVDDQLKSEANFDIGGYELQYESPKKRILKVVVRLSELEAELAKQFPKLVDPASSAEEKKAQPNAVEPISLSELHTVKAGEGLIPISGTNATRLGQSYARLFQPSCLNRQLVDMSCLEQGPHVVPCRLVWAVADSEGKTWYEKLIPNLKLKHTQGKLKTRQYGEIDQDPERRARKLKQLQKSSLEAWYEAFEEQKEDAPGVIAEAAKTLIAHIKECKELAPEAAKLSDAASLSNSTLAEAMRKLAVRIDENEKRVYPIQEARDYDAKLSALITEYHNFKQLLEDLVCPEELFDLGKRHFTAKVTDGSRTESKTNPFKDTGLTIEMLAKSVLDQSKGKVKKDGPQNKRSASKKDAKDKPSTSKKDTPKKGPSPDLIILARLLCNGLKLEGSKTNRYHLKPINPAKKITPFRDSSAELLWGSLIWEERDVLNRDVRPDSEAVPSYSHSHSASR